MHGSDDTSESGHPRRARLAARLLAGSIGLLAIWWLTGDAELEWSAIPVVPSDGTVREQAAIPPSPFDALDDPTRSRDSVAGPGSVPGPGPVSGTVDTDAPGQSFWVRIVSAEDGQPLAGAEIWDIEFADQVGACPDVTSAPEGSALAITDGDGKARLPLIDRARDDAFFLRTQPRFVVVAAGRARGLFNEESAATEREMARQIPLREAAALDVTVIGQDGNPFSDVQVSLAIRDSSGAARAADITHAEKLGVLVGFRYVNRLADAAGRVTFGCLPCGVEIRAAVLVPDLGPRRQRLGTITPVLAPGERRAVTLVARPPTDLYGIAFDQHGAPAGQLELALVRDDGQFGSTVRFFQTVINSFTTTTAVDGGFRFESVPPGPWLLVPRQQPPKRGEPLLEYAFAPVPTRVELTGAEPTRTLELELWRDLYLRGVALNPDGGPASDAIVELRLGTGEMYAKRQVEPDGAFVLGPLPDWQMELAARDEVAGQSSPSVAVRPGAALLTLKLASDEAR